MQKAQLGAPRNVSLQLLRAAACILVFIVHFGQRLKVDGLLLEATSFGAYGVQLFFLISGFLAAKTFSEHPDISLKEYYVKRAIAILPLYYLIMLYYFVSMNVFYHASIPADELGLGWLRYLFLLNGFLTSETNFWGNLGITWSIPVFAVFYLIAPFVLKRIKGIWSALFTWVGLFGITAILRRFYDCDLTAKLHYLFLGVLVYFCIQKKAVPLAAAAFQVVMIGAVILGAKAIAYTFAFATMLTVLIPIGDTLTLPTPLQKLVNVLDKYSYTIYLVHGVVFCGIIDRVPAINSSRILVTVVAVFGTIVLTWLVGKYLEKPLQKWLTKKFVKRS